MSLRPRSFALPAAALVLGLVSGFALGRRDLPDRGAGSPAPRESSSSPAPAVAPIASSSAQPTPATGESPQARLARWAARPASAERDQNLADAIAELAARDPRAALEHALHETHVWRRTELLKAAFRGWASVDPDAAIARAQTLPQADRETAIAAVFAGSAIRPDVTVALARRLCAADPSLSRDRGAAAIEALSAAGAFSAAAAFAASGEGADRDAWLAAAFARWGEQQPRAAANAALALRDAALQQRAFQSLVTGWAQTEPLPLADFAVKMPAGENRTYALGEALRQWIDRDPIAASAWVDQLDPSPDLDGAVAAIATQPFLAAHRPEVALSWAESITDASLRSHTLAAIVREWADTDRAAAARFVRASSDILGEERSDLLNLIGAQ